MSRLLPAEGSLFPKLRFFSDFRNTFTPKSLICLREGYSKNAFIRDVLAGLTVGVIALPLSMALAIGSHVRPEQGLFTAIVAGFLISLLGGSRVQIGGPAGAFMALVAGIVDMHGYQGLAICTLMAGVILVIMALARLGALIKFIPYPVTTGFTSGIAVLIFSQQIKELLGLTIRIPYQMVENNAVVEKFRTEPPAEFIEKWRVLTEFLPTTNYLALGFGAGALVCLILFRKFAPKVPASLLVVVLSAVIVGAWNLDSNHLDGGVRTIGTTFGGIPRSLPAPSFPIKLSSWEDVKVACWQARNLIPEASTIAILCAIESLLCAVVADGMIGGRHKSNCELAAQGVGNLASVVFGGVPATGVIARTAANVKSGGRTPVAGMVHALFLLAMMLVLAPYASMIPLSVLAAILIMVAWNMAELDHFRSLLKAPRSDITVLLTTFGLTVLADLTVAVGVGMALAVFLFMRRMSEVTNFDAMTREFEEPGAADSNEDGDPNSILSRDVPPGVEVYEINGPFFFGVADKLKDTLRGIAKPPRIFILRMRRVPAIDATGIHALEEFHDKCHRQHTRLLLAGVHAQPLFALTKYGLLDKFGEENMLGNIDDALAKAREILGMPPPTVVPAHVPEVAREEGDKVIR
ncbi:MAG: sulfate permease [Phycisphaerales bacterium]|nr:sulfate permease [Phycisphaerales bacterium]